VARDRKRAKQRRDRGAAVARRSAGARAGGSANGASSPGDQDVERDAELEQGLFPTPEPGALGQAAVDVETFDEALVRGGGGKPLTDADAAEFEAESEDRLQEPAGTGGGGAGGGSGSSGGGGGGGDGGGGELARPSGAPLRGGNRAIGFLRASWAELQRVQWPDRRQVTQATTVVLGFVVIAGIYLGVADEIAKEFVEFVL
jgi:preprotein translocase subunit SecE